MQTSQNEKWDRPLEHCPMCQSRRILWFDEDHHRISIYRCTQCHVQFMNPQYSDKHLENLYANYTALGDDRDARNTLHRTIDKAQSLQLVTRFHRPGRFLSIGCGDGLELGIAQSYGWDAQGFDVHRETAREVSRRLGMPVHHGNLFELQLPPASFDCVYMDQVLEHPKDPAAYLREANRLLSDQGVLFIGCPNIGSFSNRWKTWLGQKGLKRRRRGNHYGTFHHMFFYTPGILSKVLEQHGFSISHVQGRPSPNLTNPLARKLQTTLYRWMPWLDSTFQIVATKQRSLVMSEPPSIYPANANLSNSDTRGTARRAA